MAFNSPASTNTFAPKQALAPTPALYDELTGDGMENVATVTLAPLPPLPPNSIFHDNGCGTGPGTAAIVAKASATSSQVSIKGTDINSNALEIYSKRIAENGWPAEASEMDSTALTFPDETFTHSISNAMLFVYPDNGAVTAVKETYRTLKPDGIALFNTFAYVPNMEPLHIAAKATRPAGTPLPREGLKKWSDEDYVRSIVESGGFEKDKIKMTKAGFSVNTVELKRYATLLWSFIGGTSTVGWLKSDEENWDEAVGIVMDELRKTDGFEVLDGGRIRLKFIAHIVVATK